MRHEDIWELYTIGELEALLEGFEDVESLDLFHSAMFENASDLGIDRQRISLSMEDVDCEMARKHRLDESAVKILTMTSKEQFDRPVACDILRGRIMTMGSLIGQRMEEHGGSHV